MRETKNYMISADRKARYESNFGTQRSTTAQNIFRPEKVIRNKKEREKEEIITRESHEIWNAQTTRFMSLIQTNEWYRVVIHWQQMKNKSYEEK